MTLAKSGGLRPAGPPYAVARGGPFAPLRAGGRLRRASAYTLVAG